MEDMEIMEFYTPYNNPAPLELYHEQDDYIVEPSGCLDTKTQIDAFTRAGILLNSLRASKYGSELVEEGEEEEVTIMNQQNLDLTDLQQTAEKAKEVVEAINKAQQAVEEAEAKTKEEKMAEALKS